MSDEVRTLLDKIRKEHKQLREVEDKQLLELLEMLVLFIPRHATRNTENPDAARKK
jgi:hypothetical protein